jgi:hypothetical protein
MGLFDKKKKGRDDFDSPVEHVDLNAAGSQALQDHADGDADEAETVDLSSAPAPARERARSAAKAARSESGERRRASSSSYGIDDAIALMRTLPSENVELVVQVVKHTLESARIDIGAIIEDATSKQQRIESRVAVLRDAITELEREIDTRRAEIDQLETDNRETTRVKERLVLAEKLAQGGARPDTVVDGHGTGSGQLRGRSSDAPPARAKAASSPPPPPGVASSPPSGSASHVGSGNHVVPGPVGPGGPVVGGSPVGPGGPAGSYGHKSTPTHTVISKK